MKEEKVQLNNGEWVTREEFRRLRSVIDEVSKKIGYKKHEEK